jgi:hypothetical protein
MSLGNTCKLTELSSWWETILLKRKGALVELIQTCFLACHGVISDSIRLTVASGNQYAKADLMKHDC